MEIVGYNIIDKVGVGGMATVYRATQVSLERYIALKIMRESPGEDANFGDRFLREARIVAQLSHPHIIPIHDVGISNGQHYIAMEYQPGGDLKAKIAAGLTITKSLEIAKQIASALEFAHRANYVHRDVKPANILFNGQDHALLSDFGVARVCGSSSTTTTSGRLFGTPMYMSPEQVQGKETDYRTDIYSLGVILYEMLTGKPPFKGDSGVTIAVKHLTENPALLKPELQRFQPLLDKMLDKDREKRFSSGVEVADAIDVPLSGSKKKIAETDNLNQESELIADARSTETPATKRLPASRWLVGTALLATLTAVSAGVLWYQYPQTLINIAKLLNLPDSIFNIEQAGHNKQTTALSIAELAKQSRDNSKPNNPDLNTTRATNEIDPAVITQVDKPTLVKKFVADSSTANNYERIKQQQLHALLKSATAALQQKLWPIAEKDFQAILKIDKQNHIAINGLEKISYTYLEFANQALQSHDTNAASKYTENARSAFKYNEKIAELEQRIGQEKKSRQARLKEKQQELQLQKDLLQKRQQQKLLLAAQQKAQDNIISDLFTDFDNVLPQVAQSQHPIALLNEAQHLYKTASSVDKSHHRLPEFKKRLIQAHSNASAQAIARNAYRTANQIVALALNIVPNNPIFLDHKKRIEHKLETKRLIDNTIAFIDSHLNENSVTVDQLNTVLSRYEDTVKIAPLNADLVGKRTKIVNRYIDASRDALNKKDFPLVLQFASSGLTLEPGNPTLKDLRQLATDFEKKKYYAKKPHPLLPLPPFRSLALLPFLPNSIKTIG